MPSLAQLTALQFGQRRCAKPRRDVDREMRAEQQLKPQLTTARVSGQHFQQVTVRDRPSSRRYETLRPQRAEVSIIARRAWAKHRPRMGDRELDRRQQSVRHLANAKCGQRTATPYRIYKELARRRDRRGVELRRHHLLRSSRVSRAIARRSSRRPPRHHPGWRRPRARPRQSARQRRVEAREHARGVGRCSQGSKQV